MINIYNKKIKQVFFCLFLITLVSITSCKKGTFDINSPNPNALSPSTVGPKYYLTSSLSATASLMFGGGLGAFQGADILNTWMGYWSASGGFTPSPIVVSYQLTSTVGNANWDNAYLNLKNYKTIETLADADPNLQYYKGMSMIMQSFVFQRLVDFYNNVPYSQAFSNTNTTPVYDKGSDIYKSLIAKVDSAILVIKTAQANSDAENPGTYDVLFGKGTSASVTAATAWYKTAPAKWIRFANTLKLKLLMRLTQTSFGPALAQTELSGLTAADFLLAGEDAGVNPGYSTAANNQENPYYLNVAFTITGSPGTNNTYWRANSYAVDFYKNNNDPRASYFYSANKAGNIVGRKLGSTAGNEGNDNISGANGPGNAKSPAQDAIILSAFEGFFLQAEAVFRGYMPGGDAIATTLYKTAVEESFRLLGVTNAITAADAFISQPSNENVNYAVSTNKLKTLITQKWAACNSFDALESFSDWRRLQIPTDLPVSDYPGSQATHIPYRLVYPDSEGSYNSANTSEEGTIDVLTSKIFWMP